MVTFTTREEEKYIQKMSRWQVLYLEKQIPAFYHLNNKT